MTNTVPPQYWLRRWQVLLTREGDKWRKLIDSEGLLQERDATNNYYLTEDSTYSSEGNSKTNSTSNATNNGNVDAFTSDTPDGSVEDIEKYMSAGSRTTSTGTTTGKGETTGNTDSTGTTHVERVGNIGVQTAAQIIGGYRDAINYDAFETIFSELEPMFIGVWGGDYGYLYTSDT